MPVIKVDTTILVKETRYQPFLIIKSKPAKKSYFLNINFNPIATRKEYDILVTTVKKLSEEVENLKDNISTRIKDDKLDVIYKPKTDRLFYLMNILRDNYQEIKYPSGLTEADSANLLQTKDEIIHSIYEYNKAILIDNITNVNTVSPIDADYSTFIPFYPDNKTSITSKMEYFEKRLKVSIDRYLDIANNKFEIHIPSFDNFYYQFIEIKFLGKQQYYYNEPSKPITYIKNIFEYDDINKFIKNPIVSITLKGYYINPAFLKFNINISFDLRKFKTKMAENIKFKGLNRRSFTSKLLIKSITPISFGIQSDTISLLLQNRKSTSSRTLLLNPDILTRIGPEDTFIFKPQPRKSYMSYLLIANLTPQ